MKQILGVIDKKLRNLEKKKVPGAGGEGRVWCSDPDLPQALPSRCRTLPLRPGPASAVKRSFEPRKRAPRGGACQLTRTRRWPPGLFITVLPRGPGLRPRRLGCVRVGACPVARHLTVMLCFRWRKPFFCDGGQREERKRSWCGRRSGPNRLPRGVGAAYVLEPWGLSAWLPCT